MKTQDSEQVETEDELLEEARNAFEYSQYEESARLTKILLKLKSHNPLYNLMLADCYWAINKREVVIKAGLTTHDVIAGETAEGYFKQAFARDSNFLLQDDIYDIIEELTSFLIDIDLVQNLVSRVMLLTAEKPSENTSSPEEAKKIFQTIAKSTDPKQKESKKALVRWLVLSAKTGNTWLLGYDEGEFYLVTDEELVRRKENHPQGIVVWAVAEDTKTGKFKPYQFNIRKQFRFPPYSMSDKEIKRRIQKRKDYENHKTERRHKQKERDTKNKQRKHLRDKIDYIVEHSGVANTRFRD